MHEQPAEWLVTSLPKIRKVNSLLPKNLHSNNLRSFEHARLTTLEESWLDTTGIRPQETHCTIIIPVHNEHRSLPSFLRALMASQIPSSADLHFVFVVNGSNDDSAAIIYDRLSDFHSFGDIRYTVMETVIAGKANALNIGNDIALKNHHTIAMNIDANNWVEPDTIPLLFKRAHQEFSDNPGDVVLVDAKAIYAIKNNTQSPIDRFWFRVKGNNVHTPLLTGWMYAWNPEWINEVGGFPSTVTEDSAIAIEALARGRRIVHSSARIWGYISSTLVDRQKEFTRYLLGAVQLLRHFGRTSLLQNAISPEYPLDKSMWETLQYFFDDSTRGKNIAHFPLSLIKWIRYEYSLLIATLILRKKPDIQTWAPIKSTK
ncbi:hypothetical protein A3A79_01230 [Candidatus Gottesmanbacteria bacterium RIFCSPLOWO2_01_FULL_43_11b]|uniref:Glycosyltransferase 2-like domain-containing protein n=1 Tax=Candidatus Gottesmanbacteria bacterium RIFCSPLOWO2_01_FULL_43_11b TaxID=1798392 RepID=A0A1F6AH87_9BACT|nr:MAG: hypothetical protein A3A79_01230 [Candidatus Gottesmanbacteria bacterium RIFCSPLOWO2_01_FULL_43_11b]